MISSGILLKLCNGVNYYWGNDDNIRWILRDQPLKIIGLHWVKVLVAECLTIQTNLGDIFVFKSSDSKEDWEDNYKFYPIRVSDTDPISCCHLCTGSSVHTGFNKQFMFLRKELQNLRSNSSAIFTGFSLGGALATLSAYHLEYVSRELVTFGCPKVGNQQFVTNLETKVRRNERWVYKKDYVTRLPPGNYYKHAGTLNVLGYPTLRHAYNDGIFYYCNTKHYEDHDINQYIKEMGKYE
jgi:predicted lipase